MEMNTVRFRHGEDAAVTIEISDEACRAYQRCEALADQDRYEDMHCDECPLGMNVGETSLCEVDSVAELIEMRLKEMEKQNEQESIHVRLHDSDKDGGNSTGLQPRKGANT